MAKKGKRRWKGKAIFLVIVLAVLAIVATPALRVLLPYASANVPLPTEAPLPQNTIITDTKGRQIAQLTSDKKVARTVAECKDIHPYIPLAFLAAENANFYSEIGVSPKGMARAAYTNVLSGSIKQGGSTITQQYVKNMYLTPEQTMTRKVNEALLANKVENTLPKDQILCNYLNIIYFGRKTYGIEAASLQYFHKSAKNLTAGEAAYIAAIIRGPNLYQSERGQNRALELRNAILTKMATTRAALQNDPWYTNRKDPIWNYPSFTMADAESARASKKKPFPPQTMTGANVSRAPYVANLVQKYLIAKYGKDVLERGYRVKTTIDLDWQKALDNTIREAMDGRTEPRVGAVAMTKTSAIRALHGGLDITKQQYDAAYDAHRQTGSTMKPVVLTQALMEGIPKTRVYPAPARTVVKWNGPDYKVENYHETGFGKLTLEEAMWRSTNTVYVPLANQVGMDKIVERAKAMGIQDTLIEGEKVSDLPAYPSTAIGANEANVVQMATVYATLANRGLHTAPYIVEEVKDAKGKVLEQHKPESNRVIPENVADTVNQVLHGNTLNGSAKVAKLEVASAGKTGTTNEVKDLRYNGYTPEVSTAFWVGRTTPADLTGLAKKRTPGKLFQSFMNRLGLPNADFPQPSEPIVEKEPEPTQEPVPSPTPEITSEAPTETPSPTPTPETPSPSVTPETTPTPTSNKSSPTPSRTPRSSASPTPTVTETPLMVTPTGTPTP